MAHSLHTVHIVILLYVCRYFEDATAAAVHIVFLTNTAGVLLFGKIASKLQFSVTFVTSRKKKSDMFWGKLMGGIMVFESLCKSLTFLQLPVNNCCSQVSLPKVLVSDTHIVACLAAN